MIPDGLTPKRIAVFWSRALPQGDCLIWQGAPNTKGYAQFTFGVGRRILAHRLSYLLTKGAIPDGLIVRHACDVKLCIAPVHLLVGTHLDNARDKIERHRADHLHLLTDNQIRAVRHARVRGVQATALAQQYGVTPSYIISIAHGRTRRSAGGPIIHAKPNERHAEGVARAWRARAAHAARCPVPRVKLAMAWIDETGASVKDAAARFGITTGTVYDAISARRLESTSQKSSHAPSRSSPTDRSQGAQVFSVRSGTQRSGGAA